MKINSIVKYIFILIVIILICFAIYFIYYNKDKNEEIKIKQEVSQGEYYKDISIGISNYDSINPHLTKNKEVINISKLIFEPLIEIDKEYRLKLCLAKECAKINPKLYIVKINDDKKWSDGTNIDSEDIEFTINKLKEQKSIYSDNIKNIDNIELIDNSTIKINLKEEDDFFEYNLIFPILKNENFDDIPIGTGMFKINSISKEKIILEKNNNWNSQEKNNKIETINILLFSNMGELYNNFKIGNIDIVHTSNINYQNYIGTIGYKVKEYKGREYDFLSLNCENEILSNKEVRQAINYAIDKNNIISSVYNNKYYVSNSPIDYDTYLYKSENNTIKYNKEQSKKILSDSGWIYKNNVWQKSGKNIKKLSFDLIVQYDNSERVKVAELIQNQLKDVGIEIKVKKVSNEQYEKYLQNKNYDIIITGINNGFSNNLEYFYGKYNLAKYSNSEVKDILMQVRNITDNKILEEQYSNLSKIVQEDVPYIGLYRNKNILILNQKISGDFNPNNYSLFYNFETWYKQ